MIEKFIRFSIEKPLLNHIFLLFLFMLSIFAYTNIPKEIFPPMNMDKVSISGGYVGTSADVLDKMVVHNIEDALQNIETLAEITTTIKNGSFSISAEIKPGADNVTVLNDVKDVIATLKKDLPSDMNEPVAKIRTHSFPLVLIAIAGDAPKAELLERAEELKTELSALGDLSEISIRGDADEELEIRLSHEKIQAYGLSAPSVIAALKNISTIFPIGTIKEHSKHLYISTFNGEKTKEDVEATLINIGGLRLRIKDIAEVSFKLSDAQELSHYNGVRNISLNVTKSKNGNAIALVAQIRELLEKYEKRHPELVYSIYTDTSVWIKNRLNIVVSNILFGLMLVFLAMLVFINRGIAFVVALGIPVSFMIGLIATQIMGDSLNMLSLLGALIALGMLVDEAIVVAENIYRHLEEGMEPKEAAVVGAAEMFPAVLTATLTTVFAFLPMLLMSGDMGLFIKIIPIMITVLLLSSLFEAFYFLPLHSYEFLKVRRESSFSKYFWQRLYSRYEKVLQFLFRKRYLWLFVMLVSIIALTFVMMKNSKFQLFSEFDTTQVYVYGKVNINNELEDTEKIVSELEQILLEKLPKSSVSSVTSIIGFKMDAKNQAELGENLFHIFVDLHERAPENFFDRYINPVLSPESTQTVASREEDAQKISQMISASIAAMHDRRDLSGEKLFEELVVKVPGAGVVANDIEIALYSDKNQELLPALEYLQNELSKIDGVYNIANDAELGEMELKLRVNSYGQELGLSEELIASELRAYYLNAEYAKLFNAQGLVRVKLESSLSQEHDSLERIEIQVPSSSQRVRLKDVCEYYFVRSFVTLKKEDGKRTRTLYASIDKSKTTSAEVMQQLRSALSQVESQGYKLKIKGEERENRKNTRELMQAGAIALFLIFITLVTLFDSIKKSLIVISTIPLVLLGVYVGHAIMGLNMTILGMIGIVGLAGVVVNDGLIMVDFLKNVTDTEALITRAKTRLRPIFLTSMTTVLGLFTLIFFASGQAKILQPMAVSLGFGIAWATVLNLLYVPLMYAVVYKIKPKTLGEK